MIPDRKSYILVRTFVARGYNWSLSVGALIIPENQLTDQQKLHKPSEIYKNIEKNIE